MCWRPLLFSLVGEPCSAECAWRAVQRASGCEDVLFSWGRPLTYRRDLG